MDDLTTLLVAERRGDWKAIPSCITKVLLMLNSAVIDLRYEIQSANKDDQEKGNSNTVEELIKKCDVFSASLNDAEQLINKSEEDRSNLNRNATTSSSSSPLTAPSPLRKREEGGNRSKNIKLRKHRHKAAHLLPVRNSKSPSRLKRFVKSGKSNEGNQSPTLMMMNVPLGPPPLSDTEEEKTHPSDVRSPSIRLPCGSPLSYATQSVSEFSMSMTYDQPTTPPCPPKQVAIHRKTRRGIFKHS